MKSGKNISVGSIIWKVLRQPICADLSFEQAAEYALEFIRLIGAPLSFEDKVSDVKLSSYKAELPPNLISIRGVRYCGTDGLSDGIAMRYATDIYHVDIDNTESNHCQDEYTYIVQNCVLVASMKDGTVKISYKAISTDEEGYPMIPDNESYKMGLEYYIMHRFLEPLWTMGKIQDKVFNYYATERHFYVGQASSSMVIQGPDHLESVMNGVNRLLINTSAFDSGYKNFGERERIRKY